jgi:hypothetical protein
LSISWIADEATSDASMWQAPVLTVAAQAFLLQVLSDQTIDWWARLVLLLAGLLPILAAAFTLVRGHSREVQFTEAVEVHLERLGLPSLLPDHLPELPKEPERHRVESLDRRLVEVSRHRRWPRAYQLWLAALIVFVPADVVVFLATL